MSATQRNTLLMAHPGHAGSRPNCDCIPVRRTEATCPVTLVGADTCQWPHRPTGSVVAYPAHGDLRAERDIACSMFPPRTAPAYPSNERNLGFHPGGGT